MFLALVVFVAEFVFVKIGVSEYSLSVEWSDEAASVVYRIQVECKYG